MCGCSGSEQTVQQRQTQEAKPALRGPAAPDYYWNGPKTDSKQPAQKPAA